MMIITGVEIFVSSVLCDILEGAVARGGAQDAEIGFNVEGGFVLFTCTYPLIQGLEFLLSQSLAPLECI